MGRKSRAHPPGPGTLHHQHSEKNRPEVFTLSPAHRRKPGAAECACVIPSRYASTRLPGKPLSLIGGRPLIWHVWERAREANVFSRVIVATDDARIASVVRNFGGEAVMTNPDLPSGTDRVAAVARKLSTPLVMNLQGDEPFISPRALASLVQAMRRDPECPCGTLARTAEWRDIALNPSAVKVAVTAGGRALYFSRSPIPFFRDSGGPGRLLHHIGVYLYRRNYLLEFSKRRPTRLEMAERLEQLRILEHGDDIMVLVARTPALSVDTPHDLKRANEWLKAGRRSG